MRVPVKSKNFQNSFLSRITVSRTEAGPKLGNKIKEIIEKTALT